MKDLMRRNLLPIWLFLLLAMATTYPMVLNPTETIYGIVNDNMDTLNYIWAIKKVVFEGVSATAYPFRNFPESVNLIERLPMLGSEVFIWLFAILVPDAVRAYNFLILFEFTFTCFFMFLLLRHVTKNVWIASIGGAAYGFSPYFPLLVLAYGPIFLSTFLPLAILGAIRFFERPNLRNFGWAAVTGIVFLSEHFYYSYFFLVALICVAPLYALFYFKDILMWVRSLFFKIGFVNCIGTLCSVIFVFSLAYGPTVGKLEQLVAERHFSEVEAYHRSATPLFYWTPSMGNAWLGDTNAKALWGIGVSINLENFELGLYLGVLPVLMLVLAWVGRRRLDARQKKILTLFTLLIMAGLILSLGIYPLKRLDWALIPESWRSWRGPASFFFNVFPVFRFLVRYHIVTLVSLIICFAIGCKVLTQYCRRSPIANAALLAFVSLGVSLEYGNWAWYNVRNIWQDMPGAYKALSTIPGDDAVFEMPRDNIPIKVHHLAWQVYHGKKIVSDLLEKKILINVDDPESVNSLRDLGFKYVVVTTKNLGYKRLPLQKPFPDSNLARLKGVEKMGSLRLLQKFEDSNLYIFDPKKPQVIGLRKD